MVSDITLFNSAFSLNSKEQICRELNQILETKNYQLTLPEVEEILEQRRQVLLDHELADFSFSALFSIAEKMTEGTFLSRRELLRTIADCQEIFYYLHTTENDDFSDEEVLEKIFTVYEMYDGVMEQVKGYFEDQPNLREEREDEGFDE